jgi:hypothetical protein
MNMMVEIVVRHLILNVYIKTIFVYFFISDITSFILTEENESMDSQNISTIGDNSCSIDEEQSRRIFKHHEADNINSADVFFGKYV